MCSQPTPLFRLPLCALPALLPLLLAVLLAAEPADGSAPGQKRPLVYSANPQYPPYHYAAGPGAFAGASVELLRLVMPEGLPCEPRVLPWKRTLLMAEEGEIDLVLSLRITPEREKYLVFTRHPAFPNPIVVFVRRDRSFPYAGREDLKGRRGGIALGDTFGNGFDEYWPKELTIETAPTMVENFRKLDAGRIDYFVTSSYLGRAYLARNRPEHEIVPLDPPISTLGIHFGFSRRSPYAGLVGQIDARLEELGRGGELQRLLERHLELFSRDTTHVIFQ